MNDQENTAVRATFNRCFAKQYARVGSIRIGEIMTHHQHSTVGLWDLNVPLRSDVTVSLDVLDGAVVRISLGRVESRAEPLAFDLPLRPQEIPPSINIDFLEALREAAAQTLLGNHPRGLSIRHRPLVLPPLWADGHKRGVADIEVLSAVNLYRHVVLLGPPGSGKTTAAKAIAAAHMRPFMNPMPEEGPERLGLWSDTQTPVPLFVELRAFVGSAGFPRLNDRPSADTLLRFITETLFTSDRPVEMRLLEYLQRGDAILILDGLDEVPVPLAEPNALERRQEQIVELMRSVRTYFPGIRIIVTSRPAGYSGWTLPGFEVVRVRPLSGDEARELATAYYVSVGMPRAGAGQMASGLVDHLAAVPRSITEFPLFVCLLAALFRERGGEFPVRRGALLDASLSLLLGAWTERRLGDQSIRELLDCTSQDVLERLSAVALRSFAEASAVPGVDSADIPLGMLLEELIDLGPHVNPNAVLDFVSNQAGVLTSPSHRRVRFVHRLFQEYLVALAISNSSEPTAFLADRVSENPQLWREVALLLSDIFVNESRTGDLSVLIEHLVDVSIERDPVGPLAALASEIALGSNVDRDTDLRSAGIQIAAGRLASALKGDGFTGVERAICGRALAKLGDPRSGLSLGPTGCPEISWVAVPEGVVHIGSGDREIAVIERLSSGQPWNLYRELDQHEVHCTGFHIARYPITVEQFEAFVADPDGYNKDEWWPEHGLAWRARLGPPVFPLHSEVPTNAPQTGVTWYEAVAFCGWLAERLQEPIRLPTEAEWEYASKLHSTNVFPWGDEPDAAYANVLDSGIDGVVSVGVMRPPDQADDRPFDMIGNVWEWCTSLVQRSDDTFHGYPYDSGDGREDLSVGDSGFRATRGGYFGAPWVMARCAYRGRDLPNVRLDRQGFRVAKGKGNETGQ